MKTMILKNKLHQLIVNCALYYTQSQLRELNPLAVTTGFQPMLNSYILYTVNKNIFNRMRWTCRFGCYILFGANPLSPQPNGVRELYGEDDNDAGVGDEYGGVDDSWGDVGT